MKYLSCTIFLLCFSTFSMLSQEEIITFHSDNLVLNGTLSLPAGNGPFPVVILVHGSGPGDRDQTANLSDGNSMCLYPGLYGKTIKNFRDIADYLSQEGIAVLRYDKRTFTHGAILDEKKVSIYDFAADVEAALDYVKTRSEIDSEHIILAGHSQGSVLLPVVAGRRNDVAGLVSLAGPVTPVDSLLPEQFRNIYVTCANAPALGEMVASQFYDQFQKIRQGTFPLDKQIVINIPGNPSNPVPFGYGLFWLDWIEMNDSVVHNYTSTGLPVLILHGEEDLNVPVENADKFEASLPTGSTTVKKYPGINHFLTPADEPAVDSQLMEDMLQWIKTVKTSSVKELEVQHLPIVRVRTNALFLTFPSGGWDFEQFTIVNTAGKVLEKGKISAGPVVEIPHSLQPGQYFLHLSGEKTCSQSFLLKE